MPKESRALLAVHSLDRVAFAVPELGEAELFYRAFGLDVERRDGRLLLRTVGAEHVWGEIHRGPRKRLLWLRFGVFEHDLEPLAERLERAGLLDSADTNRATCRTPDGIPVEIVVAPKTSLNAKPKFGLSAAFSIDRGAGPGSSVERVRPRRMSHLALFTVDVDPAIAFYSTLGLRLSDRCGSEVAFLHSPHGSDHHIVALAKSGGPGLHHTSWDVAHLDDIGIGAMQMAEAGYHRGWGLGRHVVGSNYFHYVRDPWGSWAEYSADLDYIPAGSDWPSADHVPEDSFYQWGPPPPEDFVKNYELAGA
jgi:catechol 2,3-dioxygenase-like lactoylglutathione lyase family enzyme